MVTENISEKPLYVWRRLWASNSFCELCGHSPMTDVVSWKHAHGHTSITNCQGWMIAVPLLKEAKCKMLIILETYTSKPSSFTHLLSGWHISNLEKALIPMIIESRLGRGELGKYQRHSWFSTFELYDLPVFFLNCEMGIKILTSICHFEDQMRSCLSDVYHRA